MMSRTYPMKMSDGYVTISFIKDILIDSKYNVQ